MEVVFGQKDSWIDLNQRGKQTIKWKIVKIQNNDRRADTQAWRKRSLTDISKVIAFYVEQTLQWFAKRNRQKKAKTQSVIRKWLWCKTNDRALKKIDWLQRRANHRNIYEIKLNRNHSKKEK